MTYPIDSTDPVQLLAWQRVISTTIDLEAQLGERAGTRPMLMILVEFKKRAAEAMAAIVDAEAEDIQNIRRLQNDVRMFTDMCRELGLLIAKGVEYEQHIGDQERQDLLEFLSTLRDGEREAVELGLIEEVPNDA